MVVVNILAGILLGIVAVVTAFFLTLTILCIPISATKNYEKESPFYRRLLDISTAVILAVLRVRVHVQGEQKLPADRKLLFVGNHISNYDPIVTWYAFRKWRISFISKASNFKIPWFGAIIRRCCFMDIDRQNPRNAIVTIHRAAEYLKTQELSIGVYPEGTRSKSGELLPFHNGVFKIAQKAGADIVVIGVTGTPRIAKRTPFRKTDVYLDVLAVLPASEVCKTRTEQLGRTIAQMLQENKKRREE